MVYLTAKSKKFKNVCMSFIGKFKRLTVNVSSICLSIRLSVRIIEWHITSEVCVMFRGRSCLILKLEILKVILEHITDAR